ncbi:MAG: transcription antitermination factor NusB [Desulfovibrionaceae bacterium]|nr:transcription antitermination factor NusB [Desulfovibrionaceae bacterium]
MARPDKSLPAARAAALECLSRTLFKATDLQAALDSVLSRSGLAGRDARLATELCYGFLRLKGRVDHVLSRLLRDPAAVPRAASLALGLAVYELLFLDRVPAYASVNWAVEHVKTLTRGRLAGLANAVLRRAADLAAEARDPEFYRAGASETAFLSRYYSCPEWIVRLWVESFGRETAEACLAAQCRPPALGLWLDMSGPVPDGLAADLARDPDCLERSGAAFAFAPGSRPRALEVAPAGVVFRQSFAAHQALVALGPEHWQGPVWDACCGRGNKTRLLLGFGLDPVLASDPHPERVRALGREVPKALVFRARADAAAPLSGQVRSLVLDLPCSGLGVLSRRPDIKWKRRPRDLRDLIALQSRILDNCWTALAPGGVMAVLTCTLNPDENQGLRAGFLERTPDAALERTFATPPDTRLGEFFYSWLARRRG